MIKVYEDEMLSAFYLTRRLKGTKFFVSRKARKGAKTQGNKE